MSRLLVDEEGLADTLLRVAQLATRTVAGADLAGVTLLEDGKPTTAVFTDPTAPEVDGAQYATGVGPCLEAYRRNQVFRVDSTTEDMRWRDSSRTAAAHGIKSTLSLPLSVRGHSIGALNLYSKSHRAFTESDEETGRLFAEQASVALANSQIYESATRLTERLQEALSSRSIIDQAKGILMGSNGVSADEAFEMLVRASQEANRKLRDVAQELVERSRRI